MGRKITLDEAIAVLNKAHNMDPVELGRNAYNKQTLYNAISTKRLKRVGPRHIAKVDEVELLKLFGPKRAS